MTQVAALAVLEAKAEDAAALLRQLANRNRLLLLCLLAGPDAPAVGALAQALGISQPALSQHLARLRADGLVVARREAQVMRYRIADARVERLLLVLRDMFCPPADHPIHEGA